MCDSWGMRVRTCNGEWVIDVIRLSLTGTGRDGEWLRISRWGLHIADVRTVDELVQYVDFSELQAVLAWVALNPALSTGAAAPQVSGMRWWRHKGWLVRKSPSFGICAAGARGVCVPDATAGRGVRHTAVRSRPGPALHCGVAGARKSLAPCVFCGTTGSLSTEHVVHKWVRKALEI